MFESCCFNQEKKLSCCHKDHKKEGFMTFMSSQSPAVWCLTEDLCCLFQGVWDGVHSYRRRHRTGGTYLSSA